MTSIQDLSTTELVGQYNKAAESLGRKPVKRFADKKSAVKRTTSIFIDFLETKNPAAAKQIKAGAMTVDEVINSGQAAKAKAAKAKAEPTKVKKSRSRETVAVNFLGMRQEIRGHGNIKAVKRANSIRGQAIELLLAGATEEQLGELFAKADEKRGGNDRRNPLIRMYEMVRIFCNHYGYSTASSEDGKVITLVTLK